MPAKSFDKVSKQIKGKKGKSKLGTLHEHSRDARRLARASGRDDKVANKVAARVKANGPHINRVAFLQSCLPTDATPYDIPEIQALISLHITRNDEELTAEKDVRRPGRPPSTKELALAQEKEKDEKEYDGGFWVPDLRDEETIFSLRHWSGDWSGLNMMRFVRIDQKGVLKDSSFPPKGQS